MVCGMISMQSWLHWPDFYFGKHERSYASLVNGITIYYGINYSLIVFAYYAPVALFLSQRSNGSPAASDATAMTPGKPPAASPSSTLQVIFRFVVPLPDGARRDAHQYAFERLFWSLRSSTDDPASRPLRQPQGGEAEKGEEADAVRHHGDEHAGGDCRIEVERVQPKRDEDA